MLWVDEGLTLPQGSLAELSAHQADVRIAPTSPHRCWSGDSAGLFHCPMAPHPLFSPFSIEMYRHHYPALTHTVPSSVLPIRQGDATTISAQLQQHPCASSMLLLSFSGHPTCSRKDVPQQHARPSHQQTCCARAGSPGMYLRRSLAFVVTELKWEERKGLSTQARRLSCQL